MGFNATQPSDDAKNFGKYVVKPELAGIINALFNLGVKTTDRTDIVDALLVGLPGKTKIAPNAVPADTLKINWFATAMGSTQSLGSGSATLFRFR